MLLVDFKKVYTNIYHYCQPVIASEYGFIARQTAMSQGIGAVKLNDFKEEPARGGKF
jgi:hypothetical protein